MSNDFKPGQQDALLAAARTLPREVSPDRDLWASIEPQLGDQLPAEPAGGSVVSINRRWQAPALAASLLLALAVGYWVGQAEAPDAQHLASLPGQTDVQPLTVSLTEEVGLKEARLTMAAEIEAGLDRLPPDARLVVLENLTTINNALDEIDAVLDQAPASGLDRQLLVSMYADQLNRLSSMQSLVMNSNQEIVL